MKKRIFVYSRVRHDEEATIVAQRLFSAGLSPVANAAPPESLKIDLMAAHQSNVAAVGFHDFGHLRLSVLDRIERQTH